MNLTMGKIKWRLSLSSVAKLEGWSVEEGNRKVKLVCYVEFERWKLVGKISNWG